MEKDFQTFKINFNIRASVEIVNSAIRSKHWKNFSCAELRLAYFPYWFFSFDAFSVKEDKTISRHVSGKKTLDGVSGELSGFLSDLFEKDGSNVQDSPTDLFPFEKTEPKLSKKEAEEIAPIKIAAELGFAKENVKITGLELFFVPFWQTFATVNNQNFRIQMNAVSGEMLGIKSVPQREKGFLELTTETIRELKEPGAWVKYSKNLVNNVTSVFSSHEPKTSSAQPMLFDIKLDWRLLVIILAVIFVILIVFKVV